MRVIYFIIKIFSILVMLSEQEETLKSYKMKLRNYGENIPSEDEDDDDDLT